MSRSSNVIISDTSCLIILKKIGELELLNKIATNVYITPIIYHEFNDTIPSWIKVSAPNNQQYQKIKWTLMTVKLVQ